MKAVVAAFNQEKALVGAFSVIVQPVVEPMGHYTALINIIGNILGNFSGTDGFQWRKINDCNLYCGRNNV